MTITLRKLTGGDAAAAAEIYFDAIHNGTAPHYGAEAREAWAPRDADFDTARWKARLESGPGHIAHSGATPAGFILMDARGHLDLFFVRPAMRRFGVAEQLYDRLLDDARDLGLGRLDTHASHLARSFLQRRGWHVTARETVDRQGVQIERFAMVLDPVPA